VIALVLWASGLPWAAPTAQEPPAPPVQQRDAPPLVVPGFPPAVPATADRAAAEAAHGEAIDFLVASQNPDGSFGTSSLDGQLELGFSVETYYAWQVAAHGLATLALLDCDETPERSAALERALDWLCSTRVPQRGNHWDTDYTWAGLYGLVATVRALRDPRLADEELRARLDARGREYWRILEVTEVPSGGWAYYDDPPYARRPNWATSFCTALVLPTVAEVVALGWTADRGPLERGLTALRRCALPNGAYEYDASGALPRVGVGESINAVKGSLGRIQVCHWALYLLGDVSITPDRLRWGLEQFFEHHRFLDVAYLRPVPHEAYYANAAYFYLFGHYYAAEVIELLPRDEREAWHARLRPHLLKVQRADGSACDFLGSSYTVTAGTALFALTLQRGLAPRD
jgi:hypothetical protein